MKLIGIPTLIAGLILRFADNPQWFSGAHVVGNILIIVSAVVLAIAIVIFFLAFWSMSNDPYPRRRRRF